MSTEKISTADVPRYLISAAARKVGCHFGTLKNYEKKGYVAPARNSSGRRIYTSAQIEKLKKIFETLNPD